MEQVKFIAPNKIVDSLDRFPALGRILNGCKDQVENSAWHLEQSVYDHLVNTKKELSGIFSTLGPNYGKYLDVQIGGIPRRELVEFVSLIHDIGKNEARIRQEAGEVFDPFNKGTNLKRTFYAGHEEAGGLAIMPVLEEMRLSEEIKDYIGFLVTNHDYAHQAAEAVFKGEDRDRAVRRCKNYVGPLYPELLLHTLADLRGGTLGQVNKDEFDFRNNLLLTLITEQENHF